MRVLVYGMSSDKLGGIETFLLNMNKFMPDDMIFDYIIEGDSTIHQETIDQKGGRTLFIAPKRQLFQNIKDWNKVLKANKGEVDTVYFNMFSLAWSVPIFMAKFNGYRVIVHAHNNQLHDCSVVLKLLHRINRFLLEYTNIIRVTNSDLSAKFFFGNRKAELVYNAIDVERFAFDQNKRKEIRKNLEIDGYNVYGFSGRLAYQKNPLFLMKIFSEISKIDNKSKFLVCGDGNLADETRQLANELKLDVIFLGNVKNIQDYYQAMDCFVLPSRFEGLGIVLVEAQCSGLPCVTSNEVVPKMAKVTELLSFMKVDSSAKNWANCCVNSIRNYYNRNDYCIRIAKTRFDIKTESKNLFNIIELV